MECLTDLKVMTKITLKYEKADELGSRYNITDKWLLSLIKNLDPNKE